MRSPMDKLPLIPIPIPIIQKAITSRKRSLAMTITWRIVAELDTFLVSYLITGSLRWSLSIVGIESTTKTVLYYFHERPGDTSYGASCCTVHTETSWKPHNAYLDRP